MRSIVTVIGHDRVGIIAEVCAMLSAQNVNILDISQTILQGYFTMFMLVDVSACAIPFTELAMKLADAGKETGLDIRMLREEIFNAMHRI